jgi:phosphoribosylformimino-5-aminoimidazole carboxamide ribotide isomerase
MVSKFLVIPAVDLKGGKVVRLVQGVEDRITVQLDNPLEIAKKWIESGANCLHIIDLDGAFKGKLTHEEIIFNIRDAFRGEIQVGGGLRDFKVVERLLERGIDRVIIGTLAVENPEFVKEFARSYPGRVVVAVDAKKGRVAVKGWTKSSSLSPLDLINVFSDSEVAFLYTNIDVEGLVKGIDSEKVREVVGSTQRPVYVAGGISSIDDIKLVREAGGAGAIIGSALYTGKIDFKKALELERI